MSVARIVEDSRRRPELFHWRGAINEDVLRCRLATHGSLRFPPDLVAFWRETGGGDVFESETIVSPDPTAEGDDSILAVNRDFRRDGLPPELLVFHTGYTTSALHRDGSIVELHPRTFAVERRFANFDDWYLKTLRTELGPRYGFL